MLFPSGIEASNEMQLLTSAVSFLLVLQFTALVYAAPPEILYHCLFYTLHFFFPSSFTFQRRQARGTCLRQVSAIIFETKILFLSSNVRSLLAIVLCSEYEAKLCRSAWICMLWPHFIGIWRNVIIHSPHYRYRLLIAGL